MKDVFDKVLQQSNMWGIIILLILYSVGTYAFLNEWYGVINLTPANLLISMGLLIVASQHYWNKQFFIFLAIAWVLGYGVEVLGIKTGFPFGEYQYHEVLGFKVFDTPLMIGVNWVLLLLATRATVDRFTKLPLIAATAVSATLMLGLDFLIEPVAVDFRFWTWESATIPLSNYLSWWVISFALHYLQRMLIKNYKPDLAVAIFFIQVLFFGILNLF